MDLTGSVDRKMGRYSEMSEEGMVKGTVNWIKEHPKVTTTVGSGVIAVAGAYGVAPEKVEGGFKFLGWLLGLL